MYDDWKIPFGKEHKGKPLSDCPVSYLDWLLDQDWVTQQTKGRITDHLNSSRKVEWEALGED